MAVIALKVAVAGGKIEDRPGALHELAGSFVGKLLLAALAVGLAGYAFWRFAQAILGTELETGERLGAFKRIGLVARGALYSWLAWLCADLVIDANSSAGERQERGRRNSHGSSISRWAGGSSRLPGSPCWAPARTTSTAGSRKSSART